MPAYTKRQLSGSTDGRPIAISGTTSPGTAIHTAATATATFEEVWLWASNTATANRILTLEWGGTATTDLVIDTITAQDGMVQVSAGNLIHNSLVVRAYATATGGLNIQGFVNRLA